MRLLTRPLLFICGALSLVLGLIGVFLPVLPTTPFVLLAAFCFSRSSPRLHRLLRESRLFGPALRDWEERGAVSPPAKAMAAFVLAAAAGGMWLAPGMPLWAKIGVSTVMAGVLAFILTRPSG